MAVENRGPTLNAVCITLLTFAVTTTLLRTYVRAILVKNFGIDDWTMLFACVSFVLFCTSAIVGVHYGTGRHFADLTMPNIEEALKYWWLCYIWYCVSMIASKISIGVFLLRITVAKIHRYIIYFVMMLTVFTGLVFFFVTLLQCHPISYFWNKEQTGGACIDIEIIKALTYLYSAFSIICDFTFAILPIFLIWSLNMNRATKFALIPIMSMACVASSAVVVRLAYIEEFSNPDFLFATVDIAIWSTTEQGLAITAGSLATLRPLFRILGGKLGITQPYASTGPSVHNKPRTGRSGSGMQLDSDDKSRRVRHNLYSIPDITRVENDIDLEAANKGTTTTYVTSHGKRNSLWPQNKNSDNESEEELHMKEPSAGVETSKSFLITEERL